MTAPVTAPLYVGARRILLNALDALAGHRGAVILAGAQAIYVRTGSADLDLTVAPYTTDADPTIDPRLLGPDPRIEEAMRAGGFHLTAEPGIWSAQTLVDGTLTDIPVDLLVPETLAGKGRRSADLPDHGKNTARRTPGLEAAVADHSLLVIENLEPELDTRSLQIPVAGTAALIIAKAHKIWEWVAEAEAGRPARLKPKDASDVIRLMQADTPERVGARLRHIADDEIAGPSVREGVEHLQRLFGRRRSPGVRLAVQALSGAAPEETIAALSTAYIEALLASYTATPQGTASGPGSRG